MKISIHPSIIYRLSGGRVAGAAALTEKPRRPCPRPLPPALPGGPRGRPRTRWRDYVSRLAWERLVFTSPGRRPRGILTRCPSHLIWLLSMRRSSGSTPSPSQMTELLTLSLGEPRHPAEETHFGRLYSRSRSFGHYPQLVTIGEDGNVD